jgi:hypothetical protein
MSTRSRRTASLASMLQGSENATQPIARMSRSAMCSPSLGYADPLRSEGLQRIDQDDRKAHRICDVGQLHV